MICTKATNFAVASSHFPARNKPSKIFELEIFETNGWLFDLPTAVESLANTQNNVEKTSFQRLTSI